MAAGLLSLVSADHAPAGLPDDGAVELLLRGAAAHDSGPASRSDVVLRLRRVGGTWHPDVWGTARGFNQAIHEGRASAPATGPGTDLRVELAVRDDPWVAGGFAEYTVRFVAGPAGGSYEGWFNGLVLAGAAEVTIRAPAAAARQPAALLEIGEHPRLLFRRSRRPELLRRAQTPTGRQLLAALEQRVSSAPAGTDLDTALGQGFLYSLRGDEALGRAAIPALMHAVWNPHGGHAHDTARKLLAAALLYDLVYDLLDPKDLDLATRHLSRAGGIVAARHGLTGNWNNGPNSNWTAIGCGGAGMASLAVLRERGPFALQPAAVAGAAEQIPAPPAEGCDTNAPVSDFAAGRLVGDWLFAGPLPAPTNGAVLAAPPRRADPVPGPDGRRYAFRPLPAAAVRHPKVEFAPDAGPCLVLPDAAADSRTLLFARLRVTGSGDGAPRFLHPAAPCSVRAWISGRAVSEGMALRLEPGVHDVWLEVEGTTVCPRFEPVGAGPLLGCWRRHRYELASWQAAREQYDRTSERQDVPVHLSMVRRYTGLWLADALGDHGWKSETESYQYISLDMIMPWVAACDTALGEPLDEGTGLPWVLPLGLARACASGGGGYGAASAMGLPTPFLCYGLHRAVPELQPALLWELDRRLASPSERGQFSCRSLVYAFCYRPDGVAPLPPSETMPTLIADRRKGAWVFRNRYADRNDFVTHLFLRSEPVRGPAWFLPEAGSFRISGLGTAWAVMGSGQSKREQDYAEENVLDIPPDAGHGAGRMVYFDPLPGGGGWVVGADMTAVYARGTNRTVRAARHFAVDYTGAAGCPALFAVADRAEGGGSKRWMLHTAARGAAARGDVFTLAGRDGRAALHGRVASPPGARLSASGSTITIACDDPAAEFLVLMSVGEGSPAEWVVERAGPSLRGRLGRRTVEWTGERLRLLPGE